MFDAGVKNPSRYGQIAAINHGEDYDKPRDASRFFFGFPMVFPGKRPLDVLTKPWRENT